MTTTTTPTLAPHFLRLPQVRQLVGLSRSQLYAMMAAGTFPRPVKLGRQAVGWRPGDVQAWAEKRSAAA